MIRLDTEVGGSLKNKEWSYHIGGFYRQDAGPRTVPFMANQGGQIKANFTKKLTNGQLKFYGKYLNDRVTFYKHIPVKSLKGEPFENFDVATSSSFLSLKTIVPNSEDIPYNTASVRNFDADNAIRLQNMALGMAINQQKNDWQINNSVKLSLINQHYRQFQGNFIIPTGLAMTVFNPIALFPFATVGLAPGFPAAPAPAFPTYRDAATGEILAKFNGATPDANVPNQLGNFVYGTASLDMQNRVLDIMDNFSATYIQEKHRLTLGVYGAYAATKSLWNVDFLLTRLEPNPRPLTVIFASPYSPTTVFRGTDERGIVGYNAGAYTNFEGNSAILAGYINDYWNVSYNLKIEAGLRYEFLNYNGFKKGWSVPNESDAAAGGANLGNGLKNNGGLDGNPLTTYDNRFRLDNGSKFNFNDQYGYLSASLGFSQRVSANAALYGRATLGNKAPDIDYYVQNFVNQPITKGTTEKIWQGELGYKYTEKRSSFTLSGFYSYLDNILFQLFIPSGTTTLFTPPTFNAARTIGAEIEWLYLPTEALSFDISATLQDARFTKFTYYNVNGTTSAQAPTANRQALPNPLLDDFTENFDGNKVNDIPAVNLNLKVAYQLGRIKPYFQYRYIGQRYGNKRNTITLPAYGVINAGLLAHIGEKLTFNANINNVLNSKGIVQFDGVGVPGASIEDLAFGGVKSQNPTALGPNLNGEVINAANPSLLAIAPTDLNVVQATGRPYMVRPILPRLLTLSVSYAL
ncbi:MAG: TonB-dependent receptor [Spirosomataceae bacterium]